MRSTQTVFEEKLLTSNQLDSIFDSSTIEAGRQYITANGDDLQPVKLIVDDLTPTDIIVLFMDSNLLELSYSRRALTLVRQVMALRDRKRDAYFQFLQDNSDSSLSG